MSEIKINLEGGTSKRLLTAGKYCDKDIVVTATGGGGGTVETWTLTMEDGTEIQKQVVVE